MEKKKLKTRIYYNYDDILLYSKDNFMGIINLNMNNLNNVNSGKQPSSQLLNGPNEMSSFEKSVCNNSK